MTLSSTGAKQKPALDEGSFQQLLAAAYVVQQHNEASRKNDERPKEELPTATSRVLAMIAEIQSLIRTQSLNIADSTALIADRVLGLTRASGVSISLVDNGYLDCVAEAGVPAKIPGSSISSHSSVATDQLRSGHMFESAEAQTDSRLDSELCRDVQVGSLVTAPVLRFGEIAGLLEVRWMQAHAFGEPELRTCRLMAGLVTGTLERSVRLGNARSATVQNAHQTEEERFAAEGTPSPELPRAAAAPVIDERAAVSEVPQPTPIESQIPALKGANQVPAPCCRMCGRPFAADEQFCGFCSMPRPTEHQAEELQSKWASLWFMQRAQEVLRDSPPPTAEVKNAEDEFRAESIPDLFPDSVVSPAAPVEPRPLMWPRRAPPEPVALQAARVERLAPEIEFPFDERPPLAERTANFAKRRWRELSLAVVALGLAYGLILARPQPGQPTWYEALMSRLGLQSKPVKVFAGAPDTRVWIDVHTQLYYCSGEDLYGKTPDGEFTTQYNAQSDGFLPASNTTCP